MDVPAAGDGSVRRTALSDHRPAAVRCSDTPDPCSHRGPFRWAPPVTERAAADRPRQAPRSRAVVAEDQHAARLSDGRLDANVLRALPDDELMAELTAIPGIGPWTVQGALIIALQREDVVLPGDLALRKAVQATYQLDHLPSQQEVLAIAEKWRPYRSLASSYLFSAAFERTGAPPARPGAAT